MRVSSTNEMLKLFAIELVLLVIALYVIYVMISDGSISMGVGLEIFVVVTIVEHVVDWYFIEYD